MSSFFLKWLIITTNNGATPLQGYTTTRLYYSNKLNFRFEFETAHQPGFEPWSPGPKDAKLTIDLHSIDHLDDYVWPKLLSI